MAGNSFGRLFRITTFGESHGAGLGVVIDGCPAGIAFDLALLHADMERRRPAQSAIVTQRAETDAVEVLSGVYNGQTTGTPIALLLRNQQHRPADYDHNQHLYRPSHADFTYDQKYGFRDHRGGGRSSARETAARVAAGAVAKMLLAPLGISIVAYTSQVGEVVLHTPHHALDLTQIDRNPVRCPHPDTALQMEQLIRQVRKQGDTVGGVVSAYLSGIPTGWGEPVFDKLHAQLGKAMLSINAVKGFEYGSGFAGAHWLGSQHNDLFYTDPATHAIRTHTNWSGGVQGGISNGMDIYFRVAFKPVATLMQPQATVDQQGNAAIISGKGRHDPCVLPRAVPIVAAMAALVLADFYLLHRARSF